MLGCMNNIVKNTIIFVSGVCVGGISTYLALKGYFETKADIEIEEARNVYAERLSELEANRSSADGELEGPDDIEVKKAVKRLNNKPDLTDYTRYFTDNGERIEGAKEVLRDAAEAARDEALVETEHPEDDIPEEMTLDEELSFKNQIVTEGGKRAHSEGKYTYEISDEDYEFTHDNYEKVSFLYFTEDELLIDEDEDVVTEKRLLIGDVLEESGFMYNDSDVLYIRNDKILCDYEISKVYGSFTAVD